MGYNRNQRIRVAEARCRKLLKFAEVVTPKYDIVTCVETGTAVGVQTVLLAQMFRYVHTVEFSNAMYEKALQSLAPFQNVTLHFGDSAKVVPELTTSLGEAPVFWYLDAHWMRRDRSSHKGPLPLMSELKAIAKRGLADVVWVDDLHKFGGRDGDEGWSEVTPSSVESIFSGRLETAECTRLLGGMLLTLR